MQHLGGGLAAWNVQQYEFTNNSGRIRGKESKTGVEFEVIFYHYHYLRFFEGEKIELGRRILTESVLNIFYKPYIKRLNEIKTEISSKFPGFDPNGARGNKFQMKTPLIYLYRKITGVYNVFDEKSFLRN
jgi:hypothetical protein